MSKKILIITPIVLLLLLALAFGLFRISKSRTFQFFGEIVHRVDTQEKVVALTFDDAPTEITTETLRILSEKDVPATFFVVGKNIEEYPEIAKAIVEQGHDLGNHSYSHQRFLLSKDTYSFVKSEIEKTNALIREAGYEGEITFRPPYGKKLFVLPWYLSKHNIKTIMVDVEPDTYHSGDAEAMFAYTIEHTKPGSIILIHPDCDTVCAAGREALPKIIDELQVEGYRFVTISELLEYAPVK